MLLELLRKRRSVRKFQQRSVEKEKIDALVEAVLRSPSSRGKYPWEFVVIDDAGLLEKLSLAKAHGASFTKNAPLAIVVAADPEKSDVWVEDCSIAALIVHLAAADMGLGSCWVQIRERERKEGGMASPYLVQELGLEEGREVLAFVAIGYPHEEMAGHNRERLLWGRVRHNNDGEY